MKRHESWAKDAGRGIQQRLLEGGVCYLSRDDIDDIDGQTYVALALDGFEMLERKDEGGLMINLRRNGGGNRYLGGAPRKCIGRSHPSSLTRNRRTHARVSCRTFLCP